MYSIRSMQDARGACHRVRERCFLSVLSLPGWLVLFILPPPPPTRHPSPVTPPSVFFNALAGAETTAVASEAQGLHKFYLPSSLKLFSALYPRVCGVPAYKRYKGVLALSTMATRFLCFLGTGDDFVLPGPVFYSVVPPTHTPPPPF